MTRFAHTALIAIAALTAAGTPALAQQAAPTGFYTVELAQPATETRAIAGGVVFRCEGTRCAAPRSGNRPLRVCSDLRRAVGTVAIFNAGAEPLDADALARCNG